MELSKGTDKVQVYNVLAVVASRDCLNGQWPVRGGTDASKGTAR